MTQAKTKTGNKTDSHWVITIRNRVWSWSYEPKNISFKNQKSLRFSKTKSELCHSTMVDDKKEF